MTKEQKQDALQWLEFIVWCKEYKSKRHQQLSKKSELIYLKRVINLINN